MINTHGITNAVGNAIPLVSDCFLRGVYDSRMGRGTRDLKAWGREWGERYRRHLKANGLKLSKIAEQMDLAEVTLRSFTNGVRVPDLNEFMTMCQLAQADPSTILFGSPTVNDVALKAHKKEQPLKAPSAATDRPARKVREHV